MWHDVMVLPGVRRAVVHMEDLAQLCHTCAAKRYHLIVTQFGRNIVIQLIHSVSQHGHRLAGMTR